MDATGATGRRVSPPRCQRHRVWRHWPRLRPRYRRIRPRPK